MTAPDVRTPGGNRANAEERTNAAILAPADDAGNCDKRIATLKAGFALRGFAARDRAAGGGARVNGADQGTDELLSACKGHAR